MEKDPFQKSKVEFDLKQEENGWWNTEVKQTVKRSKDGIEWEVAEVDAKVLDKDYASAIVTCWQLLGEVSNSCDGDLFEYEHSKIYRVTDLLKKRELEG